MGSLNRHTLIGNVGHEPQIKTTESGMKVAKFTFATTETYKDKSGNKVSETEWHNIVAWRSLADLVERFVKKGTQLFIEGKVIHRKYTGTDQTEKKITETICNKIVLLQSSGKIETEREFTPNDIVH